MSPSSVDAASLATTLDEIVISSFLPLRFAHRNTEEKSFFFSHGIAIVHSRMDQPQLPSPTTADANVMSKFLTLCVYSRWTISRARRSAGLMYWLW